MASWHNLFKAVFGIGLAYLGVKHVAAALKDDDEPEAPARPLPAAGSTDAELGRPLREQISTTQEYGTRRARVYRVRTLDERMKGLLAMIRQSKESPQIHALARDLVRDYAQQGGDPADDEEVAEYIWRRVTGHAGGRVNYQNDPTVLDAFSHAWLTWQRGIGDCDDYAILYAAIFNSLGRPVELHVVRTKGHSEWNHIYPKVGLNNGRKWVALESTVPGKGFGWEVPASIVLARRKWASA